MRLHEFVIRLRSIKPFEDAVSGILLQALALAYAARKSNPFIKGGRILRATVHLRPADGYQRLVVADDFPVTPRQPTATHLPYASAWRSDAQQDRNHHKTMRCELGRVGARCKAVAGEDTRFLATLLDKDG